MSYLAFDRLIREGKLKNDHVPLSIDDFTNVFSDGAYQKDGRRISTFYTGETTVKPTLLPHATSISHQSSVDRQPRIEKGIPRLRPS